MIHDHFQHIDSLTRDQQIALDKLQSFLDSDDRVFLLKGYAGSGKTTLLKGLAAYLSQLKKPFAMMAPTGRAAKVLSSKTGFEAATIHRSIYNFKNLEELKSKDDSGDISYLYWFGLSDQSESHRRVFIVDEASMVSDKYSIQEFFRFGSGQLLRDLLEFSRVGEATTHSKVIFVGDPAQLPPVGMNFSPALDASYLSSTYGLSTIETEMKEVKRQQASTGIPQAARRVRQCLTSGFFNDFDLRSNGKDMLNPRYEDYLNDYNACNSSKVIISYKNKTASDLNRTIRMDRFGSDLPIQPTDSVIIGLNNYSHMIMNGEFAVVLDADPNVVQRRIPLLKKGGDKETISLTWRKIQLKVPDVETKFRVVSAMMLENYLYGGRDLKPKERKALYIDFKIRNPRLKPGTPEFKEAIRTDPYFNAIMLKYGYAVTCHKAQGGEWDDAFVFWDIGTQTGFNFRESSHDRTGKTNSGFYRWAYTAITRASKRLHCINPPYFTSFSTMSFEDVVISNPRQLDNSEEKPPIHVEPHEAQNVLDTFGLSDAPVTVQEHLIHHWGNLRPHNIDVSLWQRHGYEVRYQFTKDGETASFMYWLNKEHVIGKKYRKIPKATSSESLYDKIEEILMNASSIRLEGDTSEPAEPTVQQDWEIAETSPFLMNLFEAIQDGLNNELGKDSWTITQIQHLAYCERYTIERGLEVCVVDFWYNSDGFFTRVSPLAPKCNSPELLKTIKTIVASLKAT